MAAYLRDQFVKNRAFTESVLEHLFVTCHEARGGLVQSLAAEGTENEAVFFSVVIRFDRQGYRVWTWPDLQRYFRQAKGVERIAFEIDTTTSLRRSRVVGAHLVLSLDSADPNRCLIQVASDDRAWMEQTFADVTALVDKRKTLSRFVRTPVTQWLIQVCGVSLGVLVCTWAARLVAPALKVENPFLVSFLVALLIFSNTWHFLLQLIERGLRKTFPNVQFLRAEEERLHWFGQAIVGAFIAAALAQVGAMFFELVTFAVNGVVRR